MHLNEEQNPVNQRIALVIRESNSLLFGFFSFYSNLDVCILFFLLNIIHIYCACDSIFSMILYYREQQHLKYDNVKSGCPRKSIKSVKTHVGEITWLIHHSEPKCRVQPKLNGFREAFTLK